MAKASALKGRLGQPGFLRDMVLTLAAALLTGLSGSLLLILLVFGWGSATAAEDGPGGGRLTLHSQDGRPPQEAPLLHTDVEIDITGMLADVRLVQRFRNPGSSWVEGVYQFPLPPGSAVERLRMLVGERVIEGVVKEKRQAERVYRKARAEGRRASLLSQQRPNIFTTSVANIGPGEELQVEIGYQQTVPYADGRFELRFPMVVGPRYIPGSPTLSEGPLQRIHGWAADTDQVPDASQITPPVASPEQALLNPVTLKVRLDAGLPLQEVQSHYHALVETRESAGRRLLRLAEGPLPAERDFLLSWKPEPGMEPRAALFRERWQEQDYALLLLMPPEHEPQAQKLNREVVFVIDQSGSMHGDSMRQAKAALRLALSRLGVEDRFNLIHFNNHSRALFKQAKRANEANKRLALDLLERLQAEGGTEMAQALKMALEGKQSGRLRQVIFLTDGSVGNEGALFQLIRERLAESRLFTIGIGSAPNSHFMQRAADFGRGSFTYIGDLSEVEERMRTLFEKLEYPAMRDLRLSLQQASPVDLLPQRLPDLYLGEPLLLTLKAQRLEGDLHIEGDRDGTLWRHRVSLAEGGEQSGLHRLWARRRIRELMAQDRRESSPGQQRQAVTALALKHQLVSRYTSLVAVEQTPARPLSAPLKGGMMPLNLPHGWSSSHVFGRLPQTGTPAPLLILLGSMLLATGLWLRRRTL